MDYNDKLHKLINEAQSKGFDFIDGAFVENKEDNTMMKIIHVRKCDYGYIEDAGNFDVYCNVFILNDEQFDLILNSNESNILKVINQSIRGLDKDYDDDTYYRRLEDSKKTFYCEKFDSDYYDGDYDEKFYLHMAGGMYESDYFEFVLMEVAYKSLQGIEKHKAHLFSPVPS